MKYTRDKLGFRGKYNNLSNIDIITIGGSTTNQLYIDDSETWQSHMQRLFAKSGRHVTIVNAAVDGQSTRGHIAIFNRWFRQIPEMNARYILGYVGINDIALKFAENFDKMESRDPLRRIRHFIINNSAIYNLFRTVRGHIRAHSAKVIHGTKQPKIKNWKKIHLLSNSVTPPVEYSSRLIAYKKRLGELIDKIENFGATPIIVTQHTNMYMIKGAYVYFPKNPPEHFELLNYSIMRAFNNVSMEVCRKRKAICLDLARDLIFGPEDFYDLVHNNPRGTRKIAQYLYTHLESLFRPD